MNIRHQGFIWGFLFALPMLFTSTVMAQHSHAIPNHEGMHPWQDVKPSWEMADREREPHYRDHKQHGYKHYEELSPEQQKKLKQRRDAFNALPKEEQERIHKARERFRNMPPEKREKLKEKWRKMSPEEKKKARKEKYKDHH
tara:strand:- start:46553 stop:46978 length:426 start_codon:yes stop_codon:yes gene_type:complete